MDILEEEFCRPPGVGGAEKTAPHMDGHNYLDLDVAANDNNKSKLKSIS